MKMLKILNNWLINQHNMFLYMGCMREYSVVKGQSASATALSWFTSDTAHFVFHYIYRRKPSDGFTERRQDLRFYQHS